MGFDRAPFSQREYVRRLAKVRAEMAEQGLDAIFVEDPSNMAWLTGYDGWSFYVHQGVVVTHDRNPIWWGREMDANGARRTAWLGEDDLWPYDDSFVMSDRRHPMQHLATLIRELGLGEGRIGVEMENYYFSARAYVTMLEELPEAEILDATGLVNWQRAVKSDEEIAFMRKAARIAEKIVDGVFLRVEPGVRKNDIVAGVLSDAVSGIGDDWGDYPAIMPMVPSGADASAPHLTWDGADLKRDEATFFEIAGCYRRYHTPFCRTIYIGKPPYEMRLAEAALIEGLEAGLEVARAGNRACDIANALGDVLESAGIRRGARAGYPIGLSYPPDWGERTISLRAEDETVLEPGMTFHFMPGLWMEDWGIEITEPILIREDGPAECLCDRPRRIWVKD